MMKAVYGSHPTSEDSMLKKAFLVIVICAPALLLLVSCGASSEQAQRYRKQQAALAEYEKKQAEDSRTMARGVASEEDRAKAKQRQLEDEKEFANLHSSDRDVLNHAIQVMGIDRVCKAVPDLMAIMKENSEDYMAGISAQAISECHERSTYAAIVDEFLRRKATGSMIDAIGKIDIYDKRDQVLAKLGRVSAEPNEDEEVPRWAARIKQQIELAGPPHSYTP
jgi:hypothetical protein